jgi:hemin uptake protein HemP
MIPLDKQSVSPSQDTQLANPRTWDSRELLSGQAMVLIRHLGEIYRLQSTRQGKLILTK